MLLFHVLNLTEFLSIALVKGSIAYKCIMDRITENERNSAWTMKDPVKIPKPFLVGKLPL